MPIRIPDDAMDTPTPRGEEVRKLREAGLSWAEIGKRLGVSKQAAQQAAFPKARRVAQRRYERRFASR